MFWDLTWTGPGNGALVDSDGIFFKIDLSFGLLLFFRWGKHGDHSRHLIQTFWLADLFGRLATRNPQVPKKWSSKKKKKKRVDTEDGHKVRLDQINGLVHCATEEPEHDSVCQVLKEALSGGINSVRVHSAKV